MLSHGALAFGAFLRRHGISQAAAARALGVTDVAIHEWLAGSRRPRGHRAAIAIWTRGEVPEDLWLLPGERRALARIRPFASDRHARSLAGWCYVAAPLHQSARAAEAAQVLRARGVRVCSRWHDLVDASGVDPHDEDERRVLMQENLHDLSRANVVLALTDRGTPRATYAELGWALARDIRVVWLQTPQGEGGNIFDAHPRVARVFDFRDAIEIVASTSDPVVNVPLGTPALGAMTDAGSCS